MDARERHEYVDYAKLVAAAAAMLAAIAVLLYVLAMLFSGIHENVIGEVHCFKTFADMTCIHIGPR